MNFIKKKIDNILTGLNLLGKATASLVKGISILLWELLCVTGTLIVTFMEFICSVIKNKIVPFVVKLAKAFSKFCSRKAERFCEYTEYLKQVNKRKGFFGAVHFVICGDETTKRFKKSMFSAVMTYAAPVLAVVLLFNVVAFAANSEYVVQVSFAGETIAYVENEAVYEDAAAILRGRIYYAGSTGKNVELTPDFTIVRDYKHELTDKDSLADILMTYTSEELSYAYGVYSGSEFIGAVKDKSGIENYVENFLDSCKSGQNDDNLKLSNEIYYVDGLYLESSVNTDEQIEEKLSENHIISVNYTVAAGDTVQKIADKTAVTLAQLQALNSDLSDDNLEVGKVIAVRIDEPYLCVTSSHTETTVEVIKYESITHEDPTVNAGIVPVVNVKGKDGSKQVTYNVITRNGIELSREAVSETIVKEAVNEEITVGTYIYTGNQKTSDGSNSTQTVPTEKYIWPVGGSGGYISCYFSGPSEHTGLDIAAPSGTPIYAADDGVVVKAQTSYNGYGKLIVVQHEGGYLTYYAHCSYIGVSEGQKVKQGEFIGEVGTTGYSTGNHLHFEVRYGGNYMDPLNYLQR